MSGDALVPPLYERESDAAPGAFYVVKDQCIICAWPIEAAPANITWSSETFQRPNGCQSCPTHCRVERQPQTPEELTLVIEAAEGSCVQAIRYCGTDLEIIARFRSRGLENLCDALRR
jgi:hypothetical protein